MGVYDSGKIIKNARISSGLTQEQMSENICSVVALSNIENGKIGVSPLTFSLLMNRAGINKEAYPFFENIGDFKTFLSINHARFYINHWKNDLAYSALKDIEKRDFNHNKFYYQEFLLLETFYQLRSGSDRYDELISRLKVAVGITHPDFDYTNLQKAILSPTDLECLLLISYIYLIRNKNEDFISLCSQIKTHLDHMQLTGKKMIQIQLLYMVIYGSYLLGQNDYDAAYEIAEKGRSISLYNNLHAYLFECTLIYGLSMYMKRDKNKEQALQYINSAIYSAAALDSPILSKMMNVLKEYDISLSFELSPNTYMPKALFKMKDISGFRDGSFDIYGKDVLPVGKLISVLRKEQNITQQTICQGLCSKSKLSKIENGTQDGDILLVCSLLNRLGYSESIFDFFGTPNEEKYFSLLPYLSTSHSFHSEEYLNHLDALKTLGETHPLMMQSYYLYLAGSKDDIEDRLKTYNSALNISLPNFNISKIRSFRLSTDEISILLGITHELTNKSHCDEAFYYFSQIDNYIKENNPDILLIFRFYPIVKSILIRYKYTEKMVGMMSNAIEDQSNYDTCSYFLGSLSTLCYYYARYYKDNLSDDSSCLMFSKYSNYAKALTFIMDDYKNYEVIKKHLEYPK
ncbi:MAG: helix-turn-helix domain-containing protein [Butyrivibrio sp.]|nr:helix-turn-helix domain-containing protein [Butyrivibrio sp.]